LVQGEKADLPNYEGKAGRPEDMLAPALDACGRVIRILVHVALFQAAAPSASAAIQFT
jgi:hypothetical protein